MKLGPQTAKIVLDAVQTALDLEGDVELSFDLPNGVKVIVKVKVRYPEEAVPHADH